MPKSANKITHNNKSYVNLWLLSNKHRLKKERVFLAYEKKLLYVIDSTNMSVPAIIGLSPVIAIITADS